MRKVIHKDRDIDPATGAIWKQFAHGRWEPQCLKHGRADNNPNSTVICSKHWREREYKINHSCIFHDDSIIAGESKLQLQIL